MAGLLGVCWLAVQPGAVLGQGGGDLAAEGLRQCLPAPLSTGHPIFGAPTIRLDTDSVNGLPYLAQSSSLTLGDLNGDGVPDAAAAMMNFNFLTTHVTYIAVSFNQGDGVLGPPSYYTAGLGCCAVEMGDFNRDGWLDLVAVNSRDNTVSVLLNLGNGTFGPGASYPVGTLPRSVKVGDLNGDGWPDLVVLNCQSSDVSVLLNRGDATFMPERRFSVPGATVPSGTGHPFANPCVALGDYNGDRTLDIAVPCADRVGILLNEGAGNFNLAQLAPVSGFNAYEIVSADLNRDGKADLAVAVSGFGSIPANVSVLLGHGDGSFAPSVGYLTHPEIPPTSTVFTDSVDAGDLNGDGWPDLVAGHWANHGQSTVFYNRGDGTFGPATFVQSGDTGWEVRLADLGQHGRPDLAVLSSHFRTTLEVHLNDGHGNLLGYGVSTEVPQYTLFNVAVADIDGDGRIDAAATILGQDYQVRLYKNFGNERFESAGTFSYGATNQSSGYGVVLADFDGDHLPDLAVTDRINGANGLGRLWVHRNLGGFHFGAPTLYSLTAGQTGNVVAADLNGDGKPDLAIWTANSQVSVNVLINHGDGTFAPTLTYPAGAIPSFLGAALAAADLDHDGRADLVLSYGGFDAPGFITTFHNRGDGTLEALQTMPAGYRPLGLATADFDGDGFPDIAVTHTVAEGDPTPGAVYMSVYINDGHGRFGAPIDYVNSSVGLAARLAAADLNGDGHADLISSDANTGSTVLVMLNRGDGTFGAPVAYAAAGLLGGDVMSIVPADFNNDGRIDLIAPQENNYLSLLANYSCRECYANCDGSNRAPILNTGDLLCFMSRFAARDPRANCDASMTAFGAPDLNVADFVCFMQRFAAGCR